MQATTMKSTLLLVASTALALVTACSPPQNMVAPAPVADEHADHDHSGPITITATPSGAYQVGQPVTLTIRLSVQNGEPIVAEDLAMQHEHRLHIMVVDSGLEDYVHAHPTANADGTFSFTFTPKLDRPYRLWADFRLKGHEETDAGHGAEGQQHGEEHHDDGVTYASVDLPISAGVVPSIAAMQTLSAETDGLRFQLSLESQLRAGDAARVRMAIVDVQSRPFTQLEPLMGAFAHVVGFNAGATAMMHVHPNGAEPTAANARGGPTLAFTIQPEAAGPHRLFVQVRANGREVTVPFTVVVAP